MAGGYQGPINLLGSKYAAGSVLRFAASPPSAQPDTAVATREQISASERAMPVMAPSDDYNPGTQLAMVQSANLKEDVDKHSAFVDKSLSTTVFNIRQLLNLIRTSVTKDNKALEEELKAVEELWSELEQLFRVAKEAKDAVPRFMDKQKENMSLYHSSCMKDAMNDSQQEVDIQLKKVNIQNTLILEQQQAFLDYKASTEKKLKNLGELQERCSRLTLERGLLTTERDTFKQQVEASCASSEEGLKVVEYLQAEVSKLQVSKQELVSDNDSLRKDVSDLQNQLESMKQKISDHFEKEVSRLNDLLSKESQKCVALDSLVRTLRSGDSGMKAELDKMKELQRNQQLKFTNQANEFAAINKAKTDLQGQLTSAQDELASLSKENASLNKKIAKLGSLEAVHASLSASNDILQKDLKNQQGKVDKAEEECKKAKADMQTLEGKINKVAQESEALSQKLKKAHLNNEELEMENNELICKHAEFKKAMAGLNSAKSETNSLKQEVAKLQATIEDLEKEMVASSKVVQVAGDAGQGDEVLQGKVNVMEGEKAALEAQVQSMADDVDSWKELAERSYNEYKELRKACEAKDAQLKKLTNESMQSNGASGKVNEQTVKYWRDKYEAVLEKYSH
ncbi:hypothetical protein BCR34DRAFT_535926 [Clohesyomyces aquaticus]|uniref:Uncharacterized protein n=1 Tax=Clohesyomyces aquaticus TaxID=1231657 RepID=A0A1Y1ZSF8_9PLEO|nr:hypothetical protein BCR34DRAFT_535926 [Clohesyomyces aquaticus]